MSGEDELISVREAARECGRNAETVRRWIWSGKLKAEKLGNQLFIRRSIFNRFCQETEMQYMTENKPKADFFSRAVALQDRMRARVVAAIDTADSARKIREERISQLEKNMH